jgi:hypothetical protein
MPYDVATLTLIRDRAADNLAAVLAAPKPTYSIDGQSVSWAEYMERLKSEIDWATGELARLAGSTSTTKGSGFSQVLRG